MAKNGKFQYRKYLQIFVVLQIRGNPGVHPAGYQGYFIIPGIFVPDPFFLGDKAPGFYSLGVLHKVWLEFRPEGQGDINGNFIGVLFQGFPEVQGIYKAVTGHGKGRSVPHDRGKPLYHYPRPGQGIVVNLKIDEPPGVGAGEETAASQVFHILTLEILKMMGLQKLPVVPVQ
jgi:hypothetical protein